ncbi:hypothetical protein AVEN_266950-1 [Araneus ventricosus]|uniref:Uncharacterized protein n=1 Tax=Araneus ventricosus TaxID=182803 RepID=A0A4Y2KX91_ARAVE|nr:hypothetical protein AVEN_266950-1 [Araneus ventricosus]
MLPEFLENRKYYLVPERRKRPAAGLLLSSYYTPTDNREGAGETYNSEVGISSEGHQQNERPTAWLQRRHESGCSHQRATKKYSNNKKRWQAWLSAHYRHQGSL